MKKSFGLLALGAAAVAFGACSDSVVSPTTRAPGAAARSATVNATSITIVSDASSPNPTQFCSGNTQLGVFDAAHAFPAAPPALTGCGNARDLQADGSLAAYNPGWDNPTGMTVTTAHWVGFTAGAGPSSDYRPTPGLYYYSQSFTLPTGAATPSLTLQVLADNVGAVYLNGTKLGVQDYTDCNNIEGQPATQHCNWQTVNPGSGGLPSGMLTVTAASGLFNAPGVANTLVFIVADVPTGFPVLTSPVGGTPPGGFPQYGCTTRTPQIHGSHLFTGDNAVLTSAGHQGPLPTGNNMTPAPVLNVNNSAQDGCENPSGLAYAGTVSFTIPTTTWCSPGFWKNHATSPPWPADLLNANLAAAHYNTYSASYVRPPLTIAGNPTLLTVVSNPSVYKGPATNNVADVISNFIFGTPFGRGIESCPDPSDFPSN